MIEIEIPTFSEKLSNGGSSQFAALMEYKLGPRKIVIMININIAHPLCTNCRK